MRVIVVTDAATIQNVLRESFLCAYTASAMTQKNRKSLNMTPFPELGFVLQCNALSPESAAAINGPSMPPIPARRPVARDMPVMIRILLVSETQTVRATGLRVENFFAPSQRHFVVSVCLSGTDHALSIYLPKSFLTGLTLPLCVQNRMGASLRVELQNQENWPAHT